MQINCIYEALPFIGFYITYQPLGYSTSLVTEVNHRYMLENLRPIDRRENSGYTLNYHAVRLGSPFPARLLSTKEIAKCICKIYLLNVTFLQLHS